MKKEDWEKFTALLRAVKAATKGEELSMEGMSAYFMMLEDYDFDALKRVLLGLAKSNKFFPAVAEIIAAIEGTPTEKASLAWANVLKAVSLHGAHKSVKFDDPRIHYAIHRMGGWIALGKIEEEQIKWAGKDFDRYFSEADHLGVTWDYPGIQRTLLGQADCGNNREGGELMAPIAVDHWIEEPVPAGLLPAPQSMGKLIPFDRSQLGKIGRAV